MVDNKTLLKESVSIVNELFYNVTKDSEGRVTNFNIPFDTVKVIGGTSRTFLVHVNINVFNMDKEKEEQLFCSDKTLCVELFIENCKSGKYNKNDVITLNLNKANVVNGKLVNRLMESSVNMCFSDFDFSGSGGVLGDYLIYCKVYFEDDKDNYVIKGITTLKLS